MGMTMTQKILAAHAGLDKVVPGQLINAKVDMVLANDITGSVSSMYLTMPASARSLTRAKSRSSWITLRRIKI